MKLLVEFDEIRVKQPDSCPMGDLTDWASPSSRCRTCALECWTCKAMALKVMFEVPQLMQMLGKPMETEVVSADDAVAALGPMLPRGEMEVRQKFAFTELMGMDVSVAFIVQPFGCAFYLPFARKL